MSPCLALVPPGFYTLYRPGLGSINVSCPGGEPKLRDGMGEASCLPTLCWHTCRPTLPRGKAPVAWAPALHLPCFWRSMEDSEGWWVLISGAGLWVYRPAGSTCPLCNPNSAAPKACPLAGSFGYASSQWPGGGLAWVEARLRPGRLVVGLTGKLQPPHTCSILGIFVFVFNSHSLSLCL